MVDVCREGRYKKQEGEGPGAIASKGNFKGLGFLRINFYEIHSVRRNLDIGKQKKFFPTSYKKKT